MAQRQPAQELNVVLSARGLQDCDVQAHHPRTESAVVAVRIGAALVYFHDWASAATVSRGWARCSRDATWLPAQSRESMRPQQVVEPVSAVSVIDVVGGAGVPVAGRLEAVAGQPKRLFVGLGRLTIVVHDRAAYGSLRTAFATARETAAAVFPGQPAELRTVAGEIAARAMGPAQQTSQTPRSVGTAHMAQGLVAWIVLLLTTIVVWRIARFDTADIVPYGPALVLETLGALLVGA